MNTSHTLSGNMAALFSGKMSTVKAKGRIIKGTQWQLKNEMGSTITYREQECNISFKHAFT